MKTLFKGLLKLPERESLFLINNSVQKALRYKLNFYFQWLPGEYKEAILRHLFQERPKFI